MNYDPITRKKISLLFDPFYGMLNPSRIINNPYVLSASKGCYINDDDRVASERRAQWYKSNQNSNQAILARRAYEFAYVEFKRKPEIRATSTYAGPSISTKQNYQFEYCYQDITGAYSAAWCASFSSWCYYQAGWNIKIPTSSLAGALSFAGATFFQDISYNEVQAGDPVVFGTRFDSNFETDHVGLFSQWIVKPKSAKDKGIFTTIEGNTGSDEEIKPISTKTFEKTQSGISSTPGVYGKRRVYPIDRVFLGSGAQDRDVRFGRLKVENSAIRNGFKVK
jgi:hypothetical protein